MRSLKVLRVALAFSAMPLAATAQQPKVLSEVVDKIVAQEHAEMQSLRQYSPLVETYIQYLRPDKQLGEVPDGDKYFLGRAELGLYSVGSRLAVLPGQEIVRPLTGTLFPAFRLTADDPERLRRAYQRVQCLVTAIALPASIGFGLIADPVVRLALGDKWLGAIPVIQLLAAIYSLDTFGSLVTPLSMAKGETRLLFDKPAIAEKWIMEAAENQFYKTRAEDNGFVFLTTMRISESGGGMTLTSSHDSQPQTFVARLMSIPMMLLFKGVVRKAVLQDLKDYKAAVERK